MLWNFFIFFLSAVAIFGSASFLIPNLRKISGRLKLSKFAISFLMMGLATSLPEYLVGISAALKQKPILSLSNIIGSNIFVITFILGATSVLAGKIRVRKITRTQDSLLASGMVVLPLLLMIDGELSRPDGLILILAYIILVMRLLALRDKEEKLRLETTGESIIKLSIFLLGGISLLMLSAKILVDSAIKIAEYLSVSLVFFGATIIALGTALPELVFGLIAILRKERGMNFGDAFGSVIANSSLILGTTALITPIDLTGDGLNILVCSIFLFLSLLIFLIFMNTEKTLRRWEGFGLIGLYVLFLIIEFFLRS